VVYNDRYEIRVLRGVVYIMKSLEECHRVRCLRKRSSRYILHRRCEMRGRT